MEPQRPGGSNGSDQNRRGNDQQRRKRKNEPSNGPTTLERVKKEVDFECTMCFEVFILPVTLPCSHRFCKACIERHFQWNAMSCPICRLRVGVWLRKLNYNNQNIVDLDFWKIVQKKFPTGAQSNKENTEPLRHIVLAKKGEIKEEFDKQLEALNKEKKEREEKSYKLSEALIKEIEKEDRAEEEKRKKMEEEQLKADQDFARTLADVDANKTDNSSLKSEEKMDDQNIEYKCFLCTNIFKMPVALPCTHKFCKTCFEEHITKVSYNCPICGQRVSNWLRNIKNKNHNIIDCEFWRTIQEKFPTAADKNTEGQEENGNMN